MAKKSTVKAKDIASLFALVFMLIWLAFFLVTLPFKLIFALIDRKRYREEYHQDLAELQSLMQRQQLPILEKEDHPAISLDAKEELYKVYADVQWLEERVTGYNRKRTGYRMSNHGFYSDDSQTKSESIKDLVVIRSGTLYITHKRLVMLGDDHTVKEIKFKDINHINPGKRTLMVVEKSGGKPVVLQFSGVSVFSIKVIIMSLMEKPASLPKRVLADLAKLPAPAETNALATN